jgi:hypothetical protein
MCFVRVPEGKTAKNRINFDLWPTSATRDGRQAPHAALPQPLRPQGRLGFVHFRGLPWVQKRPIRR